MDDSTITNTKSLVDKLQPSTRNRLIGKKFKMFEKTGQESTDLRNWGIEPILTTEQNTSHQQSYHQKWSTAVRQTKQEALHLDLSASEVYNNFNKDDFSMISENLEDMNNFIEENYHINLTENMFLRQENHSILPFLLLSSKELHRMSLSDYEIKLVYKSVKNKIKTNRIDGMDYYKIGLINFYKGKHVLAYTKFRSALQLRPNEAVILKWLAFTCLVLIFCYKNENRQNYKIDFRNLKDVEIDEEKENNEQEDSIFFCCNNRKSKIKNLSSTMSEIENANINESNIQLNRLDLCRELEDYLSSIILNETHCIEGW